MKLNKRFSVKGEYLILLTVAGIGLNILGSRLALFLGLVVFMDSIGTILAGAIGGYIPGMIVGVLTNIILAITNSDAITLYYGILNCLFGIIAAYLSENYVFRSIWKTALSFIPFTLVGGCLGSVMTWMLYGMNFGNGISAPLSNYLYESFKLSKFFAQFTADVAIDALDKIITLAIVFVILNFVLRNRLNKFRFGYIYNGKRGDLPPLSTPKSSLKKKVISVIVTVSVFLGVVSTSVSYNVYSNLVDSSYIDQCTSVARLTAKSLGSDEIISYLNKTADAVDYLESKETIREFFESFDNIHRLYVCRAYEDGLHMVFDMNSNSEDTARRGEIVPFDETNESIKSELIAGSDVKPVTSSGTLGLMLTAYEPIRNENGDCVAYAVAEFNIDNAMGDRYMFIMRVASILFATTILAAVFSLIVADASITTPINSLAMATREFAYETESQRVLGREAVRKLDIKTGDEIENLHKAIYKLVTDFDTYIDLINQKNSEILEKTSMISKMQNNVIISFANMIEFRDENTGEHVKHTSAYVKLIAEALAADGKFPEKISETMISDMEKSAPLHDIGKIKISDMILNKPGKLNNEEFEIIKTHTTAGREILLDAMSGIDDGSYLQCAVDMATYHHEKWDGSGYPQQLSGNQIPICARIMAIADVFDALISKRPYKEPVPFENALLIIEHSAGSHFDPEIVKVFLSIKDKISEVSE